MKSDWLKLRFSLSIKLVSLFLIMAILFVILVGSTMGLAFRSHFKESIRPHLVQYLEYIVADIGSPPSIDKARSLSQKLPIDIEIIGLNEKWSSNENPVNLAAINYRRQFKQNGVSYSVGEYQGREYLVSRSPEYTVAFSVPHNRGHWYKNKVLPLLILLAMLGFLYFLIRRLFTPVKQLQLGITKIGQGDLTHRIHIKRRDELGVLANSINKMANDIQQLLEAKRQLLLAISHELRTPLTRAKVAVELLDDAKQRDEVNRDLNEMEQLINELLETERLSSQHQKLNKESVSINHLIQDLIGEQFSQHNLKVLCPNAELMLDVDVARIKLLLKNLIDNALKHSPKDSGTPQIELKHIQNKAQISVQDYGPGIDEQHLPHITEPFYRIDASRQRQTGGYGLGLYLCRVIAEAHGGQLTISSTPGAGTIVVVTLPNS